MGQSGKGRLNFVISALTDPKLTTYCERTGRVETDVIRQVVCEWIEGDRKLPAKALHHPDGGRRTNITLRYQTLGAIDDKVRDDGHASVAAVIAALLDQFLANRVDVKADEVVPVKAPLPAATYSALVAYAEREGATPEQIMVKATTAWVEAHAQKLIAKARVKNKGGV